MQSDLLTPQEWLAARPLVDDERLYAVFSSVSEADPLRTWCRLGEPRPPQPLWQGTPYAGWHQVMPYLARLPADSTFLDWVGEAKAEDWGWLAVSSSNPERIFEHLRSLTRFWDGRHLLPILTHLGAEATTLMPMFDRYLINGQTLQIGQKEIPPEQPFPWWTPSKSLLDTLEREDIGPLADNLLQWLQEEHPDLCDRLPEANLRLKIARLARRYETVANLKHALLEQLALELS